MVHWGMVLKNFLHLFTFNTFNMHPLIIPWKLNTILLTSSRVALCRRRNSFLLSPIRSKPYSSNSICAIVLLSLYRQSTQGHLSISSLFRQLDSCFIAPDTQIAHFLPLVGTLMWKWQTFLSFVGTSILSLYTARLANPKNFLFFSSFFNFNCIS